MHKFIKKILFLFLILNVNAQSQNEQTMDSLLASSSSKYDTLKIDAFNELSRLYSGTDNVKALQLAFNSYKIAKEIKSNRKIAQSLNRIGSVYDIKSQPDSANEYYLNALNLFELLHDKKGLAAVYQNIGVMYYYEDDLEKAITNYKIALQYRLETNEENYIAMLYNNIAVVLRRLKKYDEAIIYYEKALVLKQQQKDEQSIAASLQNISVAYNYKGDLKQATKYNNQAIEIYKRLNNFKDLATGYAAAAGIFVSANEIQKAKTQCLLSIEYGKKADADDVLANVYIIAYEIDTLLGNYKQASYYLTQALEYKNKVFKTEKSKSINKLQILYDTERKDKQISLLNIENEAKQKQKTQLFFIIILISIFLITTIYFYIIKQKNNTLLTKQKQEILEKTELLRFQAQEIARHQSQMNPHFIFNALNSLQGNILNEQTDKSLEQLNGLSKLMRLTLNNSEKEWISITEEKDYLSRYVDFELKRFETKFKFNIILNNEIDADNTGIPPMLIQPLIENCIKHAKLDAVIDGKIELEFIKNNGSLYVLVTDNGCGRDLSKLNTNSKALYITENRINELNNKYNLTIKNAFTIIDLKNDNGQQSGTLTQLIIPYFELI